MPNKSTGFATYENFVRVCRKEPIFKEKVSLYRTPYGYSNWREILSYVIAHSATLPSCVERRDIGNALAGLCAKQALIDDSPLRHIDVSLGESFLRTRLTGMDKPPMPFDHFMLNVPNGLLSNDEGDPVLAVLVSTFAKINTCAEKAGMQLVTPPGEGLHMVGLTRTGTLISNLKQWKNLGIAFGVRNLCQNGTRVSTVGGDEISNHALQMERVVINSILAMAYKPELITTDEISISSPKNFRRGSIPNTRDVTWIGKGFQPKSRCRITSDNADSSPVTPHWRSGHWHTVRHGKGKQESRLDWFEPVYVNAA